MKNQLDSTAYIALLRGINVGGKNSLPMKDLAAMFGKAGCSGIATYIQSGNVVFKAEKALAEKVPALIPQAILKSKMFEAPVLVRSASELQKIVKGNPFLKPGVDLKQLHVGFLADKPTPTSIAGLDPHRSAPDEFKVIGFEVYFKLPNGVGKTKLTNQYFDSKLKTTITLRNWNTVLKLLEMCGAV